MIKCCQLVLSETIDARRQTIQLVVGFKATHTRPVNGEVYEYLLVVTNVEEN